MKESQNKIKRHLLILAWILLVMVAMSAGCAKRTPSASAQSITGELMYLSVPLDYEKVEQFDTNVTIKMGTSVTIQTTKGPQTIQLTDNTTYSLDGVECGIQDLGNLRLDGNVTYACTLTYEDKTECSSVALNVWKVQRK